MGKEESNQIRQVGAQQQRDCEIGQSHAPNPKLQLKLNVIITKDETLYNRFSQRKKGN